MRRCFRPVPRHALILGSLISLFPGEAPDQEGSGAARRQLVGIVIGADLLHGLIARKVVSTLTPAPGDDAIRAAVQAALVNSRMAAQAWLDHVDIPAELGAHEAARRYAETLRSVGEFNLVLLGLGEALSGSRWGTAPGSPPVRAVMDAPKPPPERVTMSAARAIKPNAGVDVLVESALLEPVKSRIANGSAASG